MALFKKSATPKAAKAKATTDTAAAEVTNKPVKQPARFVMLPRVSEKAAQLAGTGRYVFNVPVSTGKVEIAQAIEARYGVKVTSVNTLRGIGKTVRRGRVEGRRNAWKKAVVTLKAGQKLDLFAGV